MSQSQWQAFVLSTYAGQYTILWKFDNLICDMNQVKSFVMIAVCMDLQYLIGDTI